MRERIQNFAYGDDLFVYPFLLDNSPEHWMASAASVQATRYPRDAVHINVYFDRSNPLTHEQWCHLNEAVERCWEWLNKLGG